MENKLFGTDGIRGRPGEYPLDDATVFACGLAFAEMLGDRHPAPQVVLGRDTRRSGPPLEQLIAGGLIAGGARVHSAGVISTPGVAFLAETGRFAGGVVLSASHNPYRDNGIKFFGAEGVKLSDEQEQHLESRIAALVKRILEPTPAGVPVEEDLCRLYLAHLSRSVSGGRAGDFRLVVDCAHGAASQLAPALFEQYGWRADWIGCKPDGRNINAGCGSLHLEALQKAVVERQADAGIAFDGDADRALFVSAQGKAVNGDAVLLLLANYLAGKGRLDQNLVVSTVMANLGLAKALERRGIELARTPVGDKYVLEEMLRRDASLGGEQSGHIILRDYATTGDGLLTAALTLQVLAETGDTLDALLERLPVYPQTIKNIRVKRKPPLDREPALEKAVEAARSELGENGRVVVRYSGTEPLLRIMVEARESALVERYAEQLGRVFEEHLNA